jgi:hypothetical protein
MAYSEVRLVVRMSQEYRDWLTQLRKRLRLENDSAVFDRAIMALCEVNGLAHTAPPRANPVGFQDRGKNSRHGG